MRTAEQGEAAARQLHRTSNPLMASVFYRAGIIEQWGIGTLNILDWCQENGNPPPQWQESTTGDVTVTFWPIPSAAKAVRTDQVTDQVGDQVGDQVSGQVTGQIAEQVLSFCQTPRSAAELRSLVGVKHPPTFRQNYLTPLLKTGWIERTVPDRPQSRLQRYRLTEKGRLALEGLKASAQDG